MNRKRRNPGPSWGYAFLQTAARWMPAALFRICLRAGAVVGWACMPRARQYERRYWQALLDRPPTVREQWAHFGDFAETLAAKLALAQGVRPQFHFHNAETSRDFLEICRAPGAVLFGSFHVGEADLMGAMLSDFGRIVHMVRLRVENSRDTQALEQSLAGSLRFIWVNQPEEMLFALKGALEAGQGVAMHCDREEFGARKEAFAFLGRRRCFPFTIYHLSALFQVPVGFAFALRRDGTGSIPVVTAPVFRPAPDREETITKAKTHFQDVLHLLETHLRRDPAIWFNFEPLNEPVS
ncbi:MAG: hypothetical protein JJU00_07775 [Opitutales bacterium]|nr:hypothetical protein [Opitutales bacterium]